MNDRATISLSVLKDWVDKLSVDGINSKKEVKEELITIIETLESKGDKE